MILLLLQIQTAECNIACLYEGFSGGFYRKPNCVCVELLDYEAVKAKKKKAAIKIKEPEKNDAQDYDYSPYLKTK